jgi:hypothetical protein
MSKTNNNIVNYINYIDKYVDDLTLDEKLSIYKMIMDYSTNENLIIEKGAGIEIKFKHLSHELITNIYNFVQSKIIKKQSDTARLNI